MENVTLVRAGAGSGKTYDLCADLSERIAAGAAPARIVATTFTRAAAAELRSRLERAVLTLPDVEPTRRLALASQLDQAAIGTVHAVAHALLSRYALPMGLSPHLEILDEAGAKRTIEEVLELMDPFSWAELAELARRLEIARPQELVVGLLAKKRENQIPDEAFLAQLDAGCRRLVEILASRGGAGPVVEMAELRAAATEGLEMLRQSKDSTDVTKRARELLNRLLSKQQWTWKDVLSIQKTNAGKGRKNAPGPNAQLEPMRYAAAQMLRQPELQADLAALVVQLGRQALALDAAYAAYKRERGLVDFIDLESLLLELLSRPYLRESLSAEISLVSVDEFQDTSPLQLAIFRRLAEIADESRWVGDPKQAIYGFRGTDPELVEQVIERVPAERRRQLEVSRRSQAGLVELVSRLFEPVFGADAVLQPLRPALPRGIERWRLLSKNKDDDSRALAAGIARLLREEPELTPGRIAVLTRSNKAAENVASALGELGLPALVERPGLLSTLEAALVMAGLRIVADRRDSLAAASIVHLLDGPGEDPPAWLEQRIAAVQAAAAARAAAEAARAATEAARAAAEAARAATEAARAAGEAARASGEAARAAGEAARASGEAAEVVPFPEDARLEALRRIDRLSVTPAAVIGEVVAALELERACRTWGEVPQRMSSLDALMQLAAAYEEDATRRGAAATIPGLVHHLEDLAANDKDMLAPPYGIDAVTVVTYHKAKGLEWPVVVLFELESDRDPDLFLPEVTGGMPGGEDPLEGRRLRFWPWPFGRDQYGRITSGSDLEKDARATEESAAASERERREGQRLLYVGFTRARDRLVIAHRDERYPWLETLPGVDDLLPRENRAPGEEGGFPTEYSIKSIDPALATELRAPPPAETISLSPADPPEEPEEKVPYPPRYRNPSLAERAATATTLEVVELPGAPVYPSRDEGATADRIGNAVHAYLGALPALARLAPAALEAVAARALEGFGVPGAIPAASIVAMGQRLRAWANETYPGSRWLTEAPLTAPAAAGGQWNGTADLLLRLPDGGIVIVDHKSAPLQRPRCAAKALDYSGQLEAYREALTAQGLEVRAAWVHFPLPGVMVRLGAAPA
ncbi:MAG: UvrD-helicase domain-containing protein [Polyangia bacterium]|jgi:ATP-dependent exoDNAse (exonuclease V) beta subunit|nr:UvrD-helicase domain-containing protein [Polyangia bacterium]